MTAQTMTNTPTAQASAEMRKVRQAALRRQRINRGFAYFIAILICLWVLIPILASIYPGIWLSQVPLTAVPQRTALSHAFGGLAAGLVGTAKYFYWIGHEEEMLTPFRMLAIIAEIILGYVGAAATKSVIIGAVILVTARFFVDYSIAHPLWMLAFLVLTSVTFSLFGFIIGIWADGFEKLQIVPMLILTPLTFLGGTFYSIEMLPAPWNTIALFNPIVYLISGFRWAFFGEQAADVNIGVSLAAISFFLLICLAAVWWIFKTGYRLKN